MILIGRFIARVAVKMIVLKISIFIVLLQVVNFVLSAPKTSDDVYCFATDPVKLQTKRFSKRTAYDNVRGSFNNVNISSCIPSKFWFFSRHASRLPDSKEIKSINKLGSKIDKIVKARRAGRGTLCNQDFELIEKWRFDPNITSDKSEFLTVSGWNEMKNIAKRYQKLYPKLLPKNYTNNKIIFRHTDRQRTKASIRAFADGLYGNFEQISVEEIPNPDKFLRPQDCQLLKHPKYFDDNERDAFLIGNEFKHMLAQVNNKLGLVGKKRLKAKQIQTMWTICGYENLWNSSIPSPFCGAFSIENNLILEYLDDLSSYHFFGYGRKGDLIENLNCRLIQDMLEFMENDLTIETARVYNSHSSVFQMFMVTLGALKNDDPLTASNFDEQTNRQWRNSEAFPMAANIAVIRYK